MNFKTSRKEALEVLENYVEKEITNYNSKRNFDFGPLNRENVSCLSPYITHRLITEYEVTKKVLSKHPHQKVEKYIQEIFWRVYWKGWLELRPKVWSDFIEDLKTIEENENYQKAINAQTDIQCFNDWVRELKENNYLHNHTRMWFASIWIFTLKLPWQKGAEFFMKHLLDGDAASNTLSWRWVAGLQTKGKHYVAQAWNISKFTNNKYQKVELNENALPLTDTREYKLKAPEISKEDIGSDTLLFFENDLNIESLKLKKYQNIFCIFISNEKRKIKLDEKVMNFKKKIIDDQTKRFPDTKVLEETQFEELAKKTKNFDIIYPSIGENLSFLKLIKKKKNLEYNFLLREGDEFCWQFSNKGYFNFKSNIPKIIQKII
jgi:deoxyribodipyrimidine photo-lyase